MRFTLDNSKMTLLKEVDSLSILMRLYIMEIGKTMFLQD